MKKFLLWCELKEQPYSQMDRKLSAKLSLERQDKINRYWFDADKRLSLYGGLLVRMGIQRFWNIPHENQTFAYDNMKKPYLLFKEEKEDKLIENPVYPCDRQELHFNLSHSGNMVVCIYSNQAVGIDVERMKIPFYNEVLRHFSKSEQSQCEQGKQHEQASEFYRIWTRKEAYVKCSGTGLTIELADIPTDLLQFETWYIGEYIISVFSKSEE